MAAIPYSYRQYTGNGSTTSFAVPFPYLLKAHVRVYLGFNLLDGTYTLELAETTGYTWTSGTAIQTVAAPAAGQILTVIRQTPNSQQLVEWQDGSTLISADLNTSDLQNLYAVQEQQDRNDAGIVQSTAAKTAATAATTAANTATSTANTATSTANTALSTANTALSTANTASTNASAAVTTANTASTNASAAVTTANSANTTAGTANTNAAAAVTTANSAAASASTAVTTANTASTNASAAVSTANTASSNASAAVSTANTASTNASAAVTTANSAATNASTALSTANTASTNASAAVATANAANTKADSAINAVASSVNYTPIGNVAGIPSTPANNTYIEIADSTGLQSFTPLAGMPAGFVGDAGLSVRLRYTTSPATWNWLNYYANNADSRYLKLAGGTLTGTLTLAANPSTALQPATKQYTDAADATLTTAAAAAQTTANTGVANAAAAQTTANAAVVRSGDTMTGALGVTAGTAAAPSLFISGSTNTGLYSPGSGQVAISTNGTGRLFVDSSGRVGLGTSAPGYKFEVDNTGGSTATARLVGNDQANVRLRIQNTGSGGRAYEIVGGLNGTNNSCLSVYDATAAATRLTITDTGAVGIGTTSPGATLHVDATSGATIRVSRISASAGAYGQLEHDGTNTTLTSTAATVFVNNSNERARLTSDGKFLVGTSSSRGNIYQGGAAYQPKVQIEGAANDYTTGLSLINYSASGFGPVITLGLSQSNTQGTNTIVNNGVELGTIQFVGNDGTNFRTGATIQANFDGTPGTADVPTRLVFSTTADGASSPTEQMRIAANGQILMCGATQAILGAGNTNTGVGFERASDGGTAFFSRSSNTPFYVNRNTDGVSIDIRRSGNPVGSISVTTSATAYNTSSDYRLKENVTAVSNGITRLQQLKPSRFNFKADPDKVVDGFIAHEAAEVVPECVSGEKDAVDDDGNPVYQGIDQSKLVPLLTAALQEAIAEIASLKDRVAALEGV